MTNPNDARSRWLILTDKGMEAVVYYRNRIRSNVKGMTKNFSEQEMDGMIGLMAQMNSFLDSKRVEGTKRGKAHQHGHISPYLRNAEL